MVASDSLANWIWIFPGVVGLSWDFLKNSNLLEVRKAANHSRKTVITAEIDNSAAVIRIFDRY